MSLMHSPTTTARSNSNISDGKAATGNQSSCFSDGDENAVQKPIDKFRSVSNGFVSMFGRGDDAKGAVPKPILKFGAASSGSMSMFGHGRSHTVGITNLLTAIIRLQPL